MTTTILILALLAIIICTILAVKTHIEIEKLDHAIKTVDISESVNGEGETFNRIHTHETLRNLYRLDYTIDGMVEIHEPSGRRLAVVNSREAAIEYVTRHHDS